MTVCFGEVNHNSRQNDKILVNETICVKVALILQRVVCHWRNLVVVVRAVQAQTATMDTHADPISVFDDSWYQLVPGFWKMALSLVGNGKWQLLNIEMCIRNSQALYTRQHTSEFICN